MDNLSKTETVDGSLSRWFVVKKEEAPEDVHDVWDNLGAVLFRGFAYYLDVGGENMDINPAYKTRCWEAVRWA